MGMLDWLFGSDEPEPNPEHIAQLRRIEKGLAEYSAKLDRVERSVATYSEADKIEWYKSQSK